MNHHHLSPCVDNHRIRHGSHEESVYTFYQCCNSSSLIYTFSFYIVDILSLDIAFVIGLIPEVGGLVNVLFGVGVCVPLLSVGLILVGGGVDVVGVTFVVVGGLVVVGGFVLVGVDVDPLEPLILTYPLPLSLIHI